MYGYTYTQLIDRLDDDAGLEVEAAAPDVFVIAQSERRGIACGVCVGIGVGHIGVAEIFGIIGILFEIEVSNAETNAPIEHIHDIAAKVD